MAALPSSIAPRVPRQARARDGNGVNTREDPRVLWTRVQETRTSLAASRTRLDGSMQYARARWNHLEALQAYADCLLAHHRPVPYRLRDELRLLQLTCATDPH
ncbi:MAG: hypothetical protein JWR20_1309 [Marmoricola sp.]|nr:hypothetical protein [Marmoricola sp.]